VKKRFQQRKIEPKRIHRAMFPVDKKREKKEQRHNSGVFVAQEEYCQGSREREGEKGLGGRK